MLPLAWTLLHWQELTGNNIVNLPRKNHSIHQQTKKNTSVSSKRHDRSILNYEANYICITYFNAGRSSTNNNKVQQSGSFFVRCTGDALQIRKALVQFANTFLINLRCPLKTLNNFLTNSSRVIEFLRQKKNKR